MPWHISRTSGALRSNRHARAARRFRCNFEMLENHLLLSGSSTPLDAFPSLSPQDGSFNFAKLTAPAQVIVLDANGSGSQTGSIDADTDSSYFRFVAPVTGLMKIEALPDGPDSGLGLMLYADGASQLRYSPNKVAIEVLAGETYQIALSNSDDASVSDFTIVLNTDVSDFLYYVSSSSTPTILTSGDLDVCRS